MKKLTLALSLLLITITATTLCSGKALIHTVDKTLIEAKLAETACIPSISNTKKFIFTGGPSAGKTTILLALEQWHAHTIVHEAATSVIALEVAQGKTDPEHFTSDEVNNKIIALQNQRITRAQNLNSQSIMLDRSPIDVLAYQQDIKSPGYENNLNKACTIANDPSFSKKIFLIEGLGKITANQVRKEDEEEAKQLEAAFIHNYEAFGFEIVKIPAGTVQERVNRVLEVINSES